MEREKRDVGAAPNPPARAAHYASVSTQPLRTTNLTDACGRNLPGRRTARLRADVAVGGDLSATVRSGGAPLSLHRHAAFISIPVAFG